MRLDGNTCLARRKYEIKMFNSKRGDQFVYLLSTRAGALGITLTGADTVIMFDSDWNPTWDKQAHDRVGVCALSCQRSRLAHPSCMLVALLSQVERDGCGLM